MWPEPNISKVTFRGFSVDVLRLDQVHPEISGNKWYKLKYNLSKIQGHSNAILLTYGGTHSNHIAATAAACKQMNIPCACIVGGEDQTSDTLRLAEAHGMRVYKVSRNDFKNKHFDQVKQELYTAFDAIVEVPLGGNNTEGMWGCTEIPIPEGYDKVCVACGTGTTFAGLSLNPQIKSLTGFSVLKGNNTLPEAVMELHKRTGIKGPYIGSTIYDNYAIVNHYAGKGFASFEANVFVFAQAFAKQTGIELDMVYTSKLVYGVFDLLNQGIWHHQQPILVVHTGGLQGNSAFYQRYSLQISQIQDIAGEP